MNKAKLDIDININPSSECDYSLRILNYGKESAAALLKAYKVARVNRGNKKGMTTDQEQDLLRSMLIMATAGLDAMCKQLIRDALPTLLEFNSQALNTFEKFIARKLENKSEPDSEKASKFLARILSRPSPQEQLIEDYILDLTKGSLQSTSSLFQVVAALGVSPDLVGIDNERHSKIFGIRNKIVHELDINLEAPRRNREMRKQSDMIDFTYAILEIARNILSEVNEQILNK